MEPIFSSDDERVTLYQADALVVLLSLASESANAILLDPPYSMTPNAVRGKDDGAAGTSASPYRLLHQSLTESYRILVDGGAAFLICDWRRMPDVSYMATLAGFRISTCVAWTRTRPGTGGMFRSAWDPVLVLSKGAPGVLDRAAIPNVICANPPAVRVHPYEKPVALWRHLLQRVPAGRVIDAYAGSGASLQPALESGHTWLGIEVDALYCRIIVGQLGQSMLPFDETA